MITNIVKLQTFGQAYTKFPFQLIRYKQYLYWKQMAKAATVIQNKYRTYCEHKRFKKSQEAAMCIQSFYRTYREHQTTTKSSSRSSRESTPSTSGIK